MISQKLTHRAHSLVWKTHELLRKGRPNLLVCYDGGIGDDLLCTAVFRELRKRGYHGLWMMSPHKELFSLNRDIDVIVPYDQRYFELTSRMGGRIVTPHYTVKDSKTDCDTAPTRHIISCMCSIAGVTGHVALRPYLHLLDTERETGRLVPRQIAIQSSGRSARYYMQNKEWFPERFQQVVDALKKDYAFVQVGSLDDPPLRDVIDMRGRTSIRQTAAILSESLVFVGLVGFLMHLARAVDCRGVIVYGGREAPALSGYPSNVNLYTSLPCSPCWKWNTCEFERDCMRRIQADEVIAAVLSQVNCLGTPLHTDEDDISSVA